MIYYYSHSNIMKTNLNLEQFSNEIDKNKCNNQVTNNFLDKYKHCLINSYLEEENTIFNYTGRENYYQSIIICNEEIRIHFNITKALSYIKNYSYNIQQVSLSYFAPNNFDDNISSISYSPVCINSNYSYEKNNSPIILIYFPLGKHTYITIDGNHRVSYRIKNKISCINAILLSYDDTLSLIDSKFEKCLYSFYYCSNDFNK